MMRLLLTAVFAMAVSAAADLSGIWTGLIPTRNGDVQDIAFQLTQKGTVISGKLYGDYRSSRIVEGKVDGDAISFVVVVQDQAGNQINETRYKFHGTVTGAEIELTRERESARTAGNGGGVQFRGNAAQKFRLKRLM